jgi:hypothetical protein
VIAAYLGYLGVRATVETPIHATQTAEARVTPILPTATTIVTATSTIENIVQLPTAQPSQIPTITSEIFVYPTSTPLKQEFSVLTFCYRSELDSQTSQCTLSRVIFTSPVTEICVSWIPSPQYLGSSFRRIWRNNTTGATSSNENSNTFGCLYWKAGLAVGQYDVELLVNNFMVQKGSFLIQR